MQNGASVLGNQNRRVKNWYERKRAGVRKETKPSRDSGSTQVNTDAGASITDLKFSPKQRRNRGLSRLTEKQRQALENKYGYDLESQRFRSNVSKSSKKKAKKILKSVGRFRLGDRLIGFRR